MMVDDAPTDADVALALLAKVRAFAASLDGIERSLFAALLAPGVDAAWADDGDDVAVHVWRPTHLPRHLVQAVRAADLRITPAAWDPPETPDPGAH